MHASPPMPAETGTFVEVMEVGGEWFVRVVAEGRETINWFQIKSRATRLRRRLAEAPQSRKDRSTLAALSRFCATGRAEQEVPPLCLEARGPLPGLRPTLATGFRYFGA